MLDAMSALLEFLGSVVLYGGGAAAIAYGIFMFLGKKWIDARFEDRLEASRHEHAKELERLKVEVNALLNRVTRLQDKEFEVVSELWGKLNDANAKLAYFTSVFQSFPDLEKMSQPRLDEFLAESRLLESEREEVRNAERMNDRYQELIFGYDLNDVHRTYSDFHVYLTKNRIYLAPELAKPLNEIDAKMWDAFQKRSIGKQIDDIEKWVDASRQMRDDIGPAISELESNVQKTLNRKVE